MRRPCWVRPPRRSESRARLAAARRRAAGRPRLRPRPHLAARAPGGAPRGPATARLRGWVERRAAGEPIAYIRGFKEWLSLRIATDPRALIPRPETELLAEAAIGEIAARLVRDDAPSPPGRWRPAAAPWPLPSRCASAPRSRWAGCGWRPATSRRRRWSWPRRTWLPTASAAWSPWPAATCWSRRAARAPAADLLIANLPYLTSAEVAAGAGSLRLEPRARAGWRRRWPRPDPPAARASCRPAGARRRGAAGDRARPGGGGPRGGGRRADPRPGHDPAATWPGIQRVVRIERAMTETDGCPPRPPGSRGGGDPAPRRAGGFPDRHRLRARLRGLASRTRSTPSSPSSGGRRRRRSRWLVGGLAGRALPRRGSWTSRATRPRRSLLAGRADAGAALAGRRRSTQAFRVPDHPVALACWRPPGRWPSPARTSA